MENMKLDLSRLSEFIPEKVIQSYEEDVRANLQKLHGGSGAGNDFLGWIDLPSSIKKAGLDDIRQTADKLKANSDIVVVIGIGGSYLGAKAVIDGLSDSFDALKTERGAPLVLFAGNNIGEDYLSELRDVLAEKDYALIVISKSGTTTEPAIAFRILKNDIEEKYGKEEAKNRIIAITDKGKGALRNLADNMGYKSYVIPDDVGGRFSVLTPVGLLPIAVAGKDIYQLVEGAREMEKLTGKGTPFLGNPAALYAAVRNDMYKRGKQLEILVNYNPKLHFFAEWWKQLYGESEGKDNKGIYPASVDFTTDLHSMGQYIQEGKRNLFETVLSVESPDKELKIPRDKENLDGLNYLSGKRVDEVNQMAELGTMLAHMDGDVPNIRVSIPRLNAYYLGQMIYFFEKACAISGYLLNVNPFDQPGVEAYKKNMFALLKKPGFEKETEEIYDKLER